MPDPAPPVAHVAHAVAGRTRLRLPALRDDPARATAIAERLRGLPGVAGVRASATTGSIVIHHRAPWPEVAARCAGIVAITADAPPAPASLDVRDALSAGFGALAALQLLRGAVLPPAITLLWYAAALVRGRAGEPS